MSWITQDYPMVLPYTITTRKHPVEVAISVCKATSHGSCSMKMILHHRNLYIKSLTSMIQMACRSDNSGKLELLRSVPLRCPMGPRQCCEAPTQFTGFRKMLIFLSMVQWRTTNDIVGESYGILANSPRLTSLSDVSSM